MKSIDQIINTREYKCHTFGAAIKEFACDSGTSLYYDGLAYIALIYHLKDSKNIKIPIDEMIITRIPNMLKYIENSVSKEVYDTLQEIYNQFMKLAAQYEYEDGFKPDLFNTYGIKGYPEMWESKEFAETFRKDVAEIVKQLKPIQDLVSAL